MPTIDVAIVAFNHYELTESCLGTWPRRRASTLIVCDNGSTDGTAERVARGLAGRAGPAPRDQPRLRGRLQRRRGGGGGDDVVLINNDVDCRPDFLEKLVAPLERDPELGSVAALCVRPGGEHIDSIGLTSDATLSPFPRLQGRPVGEAAPSARCCSGPPAPRRAYRRTAWEAVGGLDERIFAYGEDFDLACGCAPRAGRRPRARRRRHPPRLGHLRPPHRPQRRYGGFGRAYLMRRYGLLAAAGGPHRADRGDRGRRRRASSRATWPRCGAASKAGARRRGLP